MGRPFDEVRIVQRFPYLAYAANYTGGVMALLKCALGLALAVPILAQNTALLEGSVTNSITHAGIGGVAITIAGKTTYRATSDASGAFRAEAVNSGDYVATFEAPDFMAPQPRPLRVTAEDRAARIDVALTAWAKIAGKVVDGEGRPAARVQVEMGRLRGGGGSITGTDDEGRFLVRGMGPGTYVLLARPILAGSAAAEGRPQRVSGLSPRPAGERTVWAPTYFPNATEYSRRSRSSFGAARNWRDTTSGWRRFRCIACVVWSSTRMTGLRPALR